MSDNSRLIERLSQIIVTHPAAVLTGAGVSTDSGLPDYRGEGSAPREPMRIGAFLTDEAYRRRFWAGARIGADRMASIEPNAAHYALARLEMAGNVLGIATQNVDGLHRAAGSRTVAELHGRGDITRCARCHRTQRRSSVLARFDELNPGFTQQHASATLAPDGDADVGDVSDVIVPDCEVCEGVLRPDIVYFGETAPNPVFHSAAALVQGSEALIIAGTSLTVNTGQRLVHRAEQLGNPIIVINRGPTTVDDRPSISLRIDGNVGEVFDGLAEHLC